MSEIWLGLQDIEPPPGDLRMKLLSTTEHMTVKQFHWIGRRIHADLIGREFSFWTVRVRQNAHTRHVDAEVHPAIRVQIDELVHEFNEAFQCVAQPGDGWFEWYASEHEMTTEDASLIHGMLGCPTVRIVSFTPCAAARPKIHNRTHLSIARPLSQTRARRARRGSGRTSPR